MARCPAESGLSSLCENTGQCVGPARLRAQRWERAGVQRGVRQAQSPAESPGTPAVGVQALRSPLGQSGPHLSGVKSL